jgi:hypothetical protein
MLGYIQTKIAIAYRTRLTNQVLNTYLGTENGEDKVYYKMCECSFVTPLLSIPLTSRFLKPI